MQEEEKKDEADSQGDSEYYARNIGLAKQGSNLTYSFLVSGKEEKGAQTRVLNTFFVHGAKILSQTGYLDEKFGEFTLSLSCDLRAADISSDDLIIELRRFKFVRTVVSQNMRNRFFDRQLFPLTMTDTVRVIAMDSDFFAELGEKLGENRQSSLALRDLAQSYAVRVVDRFRQLCGRKASPVSIQENSLAYFRAIGLGTVRMQSDSVVESVIIQDPPTNKRGEAAGNPLMHGIAVGLVAALKMKSTHLSKENYDQTNRLLTLTLSAGPTEVSRPAPEDEIQESDLSEARRAVVPLYEISRAQGRNESPEPTEYESEFFNDASYRELA